MLACARLILYTNPLEYFTMSERTHRPSRIPSATELYEHLGRETAPHRAAIEKATCGHMDSHAHNIAIKPNNWQWCTLDDFSMAFCGTLYEDTPGALIVGNSLERCGIGTHQLRGALATEDSKLQPFLAEPNTLDMTRPYHKIYLPIHPDPDTALAIYALSYRRGIMADSGTFHGKVFLPTLVMSTNPKEADSMQPSHEVMQILHVSRPLRTTDLAFKEVRDDHGHQEKMGLARFLSRHIIGHEAVRSSLIDRTESADAARHATQTMDILVRAAQNPAYTALKHWSNAIKGR